MILNETPVRTSRNFNINNIELKDIKIPNEISNFDNVQIINNSAKIIIEEKNYESNKLKYGLGEFFENQVKENANQNIKVIIDSKVNKEAEIDFNLDEKNMNLVEDIEITANDGCKGTIIIKYNSTKMVDCFHNGIIKVNVKKDANINVIIANLMDENTNNFLAIESILEEGSKAKFTLVDFGGKNSITNYYSDLLGDNSENTIDTIYLGKEEKLLDINYIGELRGKKSNINIEVQGALKDSARKHFKGTIDFKRGAKKATGNENEACTLLSDTAKSLALPMLLCSEEDVEGNHSCSSGKVGEKELFYIMSRGFDLKSAIKLIVRAKFNKILENIQNEKLKNEIIYKIDEF